MNSQTISISVQRPVDEVYDFLSMPEHFRQWAAGLGKLEKHGKEWFVETPDSRMQVRFTGRNDFGIVDHFVQPENAGEIYVPMRVVANGKFAEVVVTLFQQPSMSDVDFAHDLDMVRTDLNSLKNILESTRN